MRSRRPRRTLRLTESLPTHAPHHPLAVDWWLCAFNIAMAAIWAPLAPAHPTARLLLGCHLLAATLPMLLGWAPPPRARALRLVYDAYPLAWAAAFWTELDLHTRFVNTLRDDQALLSLDRAVFGGHLNQAWLAKMQAGALSELMYLLYLSYYLLLVGVPVFLFFRGTEAQVREGVLRIVLAYLGCILVHAWWPTIGPAVLPLQFPAPLSARWFFRLSHWIADGGDSLGTAFPSTHVAGAVTFAWIAWRFWSREVALGVTLLAVGIMAAAVYTQNHFAVDSLAGAPLGLALQGLVVPLYTKPGVRAEDAAPVVIEESSP